MNTLEGGCRPKRTESVPCSENCTHLGGLPVPLPPLDAPPQSLNKQAINALAFNSDGARLVFGRGFRRGESVESTDAKDAIHYPSTARSLLWRIDHLQR